MKKVKSVPEFINVFNRLLPNDHDLDLLSIENHGGNLSIDSRELFKKEIKRSKKDAVQSMIHDLALNTNISDVFLWSVNFLKLDEGDSSIRPFVFALFNDEPIYYSDPGKEILLSYLEVDTGIVLARGAEDFLNLLLLFVGKRMTEMYGKEPVVFDDEKFASLKGAKLFLTF